MSRRFTFVTVVAHRRRRVPGRRDLRRRRDAVLIASAWRPGDKAISSAAPAVESGANRRVGRAARQLRRRRRAHQPGGRQHRRDDDGTRSAQPAKPRGPRGAGSARRTERPRPAVRARHAAPRRGQRLHHRRRRQHPDQQPRHRPRRADHRQAVGRPDASRARRRRRSGHRHRADQGGRPDRAAGGAARRLLDAADGRVGRARSATRSATSTASRSASSATSAGSCSTRASTTTSRPTRRSISATAAGR